MASKCLESPAYFYDTNVGGRAVPFAAAFWEMARHIWPVVRMQFA